MTDMRYPYTYACDFIREHGTNFDERIGMELPILSRSQASQVMAAFEKVFGLTHEEMAKKLADFYLSREATEIGDGQ